MRILASGVHVLANIRTPLVVLLVKTYFFKPRAFQPVT
jgi:hypothetical protein